MGQSQRLLFRGPNCEETLDPMPDEVLAVMALPYDEHWGYQPVAELQWLAPGGGREPTAQLVLVRHPDWWYFEYTQSPGSGEAREWLAPFDPAVTPGYVLHWLWGNRQWYRAASLVPEGPAQQVVTDFMATGRPSPAVAWARGLDVESRLECDEYATRFGSGPDAEPRATPDAGR